MRRDGSSRGMSPTDFRMRAITERGHSPTFTSTAAAIERGGGPVPGAWAVFFYAIEDFFLVHANADEHIANDAHDQGQYTQNSE